MEFDNFLPAFLLTLFAGLSTGIGSLIAFFTKQTNKVFLAIALGFSAGVMIYVSFMEMLPEAFSSLSIVYGKKNGAIYALLSFFCGIILTGLIDKLVPDKENPHEMKAVEDMSESKLKQNQNFKLMRVGIFTAVVLAIHNFPEGIATMLSGIKDFKLAIPIAIAIAIHNIPEGISVSVPIYYATGKRRKAFWLSFASGLSEPIGAVVGYLLIAPYLTESLFGAIFAIIAGIMVYISFDELLPAAETYGKHHQAIYGLIAGMAVMSATLVLI